MGPMLSPLLDESLQAGVDALRNPLDIEGLGRRELVESGAADRGFAAFGIVVSSYDP